MNEKKDILDTFAKYVNPQKIRVLHSAGLDILETQRQGVWVTDVDGRRFLDCFTSAGSFNIGRRHPKIIEALRYGADHFDHGNFLLASEQKALLAQELALVTPGDLNCFMYGTGGGEAVDFAIKLARGTTGRKKIVSMRLGYHGHTGFALSAAGRSVYRDPFEPLMPGFEIITFGDFKEAERVIDDQTAGVIVEPIQGEGGIVVPPADYLKALRELCTKTKALLIIDEIQTGLGRTGKWFAQEHFGVVGDIMCIAKSLGGSVVSISVTAFNEELREFLIPNPFIHLSTFGGSDLACYVARNVLKIIKEENLIEHSEKMGKLLQQGLLDLKAKFPDEIQEVRGINLMAGLKFSDDSFGPRMSYNLANHGVLAIYTGNEPSVMRIMPPIVITKEEVEFLINAFELALTDLKHNKGPQDEPIKTRRRPIRK
jgi:putrescine aminotransferase